MGTINFAEAHIPPNFYWLNVPLSFDYQQGLKLITKPHTDFWQGTHYGFRRDDGHCLLTELAGDFQVQTSVTFQPVSQYDQCGLIIRVDAKNWLKCSVEFENSSISRLGSVVTNLGFSDWATQTISSTIQRMDYRASRRGSDFLLEYSPDGSQWHQMRIAHLHHCPPTLQVGLYACSPVGERFECCFKYFEMADNAWFPH
jgi:regulation of enolase protein 1 (concanavalin A-like superfamily)